MKLKDKLKLNLCPDDIYSFWPKSNSSDFLALPEPSFQITYYNKEGVEYEVTLIE